MEEYLAGSIKERIFLLIAAILLALCTLQLAKFVDQREVGFFVAGALFSGLIYLAAIVFVLKRPGGTGTLVFVLAVAVLLRLLSMTGEPNLTSDALRYVWDGRLGWEGINPYLYVPADEHLAHLRDTAIYPGINQKEHAVTIYPPVAQLIFMAGGATAAIQTVTPVLMDMGSAVHALGRSGTGSAMKLAVNSLFATQVVAMAEQLALLDDQQVDLVSALAALKSMPVTSPAAAGAASAMLARAYAPQFPVQLAAKDLGYALAAARHELPLTAAVLGRLQAARDAALGDENLVAVHKLYT